MPDSEPKLILYVDDERSNRVVFEHTFNDRFPVLVVDSGEEAVRVLEQDRVAVLVTDQRMPGMSGNELLEWSKANRPEVIRLVITAYSDLDPILRAVNGGLVARYVIKPWVRVDLEEMLTWALEAYHIGKVSSGAQLRLLENERLATLGSVHAAMVHDINQPLSLVIATAECLAEQGTSCNVLKEVVKASKQLVTAREYKQLTDLANDLPDLIEDILKGCRLIEGMARGVSRLLGGFSEADGGQGRELPHDAVQFALSICRGTIGGAHGDLHYRGPETLPPLVLGFVSLSQVIINLLSNAAQAIERNSPPGGKVVLRCAEQAERVEFSVSDTGPGMSEELLKKVSKPFFTTRQGGTGLGLPQCRRLVEQAAGEFSIESTEEVGTTVRFSLRKAGLRPTQKI